MPDDTKPASDKTTADNGSKTTKPASDKTTATAPAALSYTLDADGRALTGNLTRDSIIETVRGKLVAEGKPDDEALEAGVKRGFQMIKDG